MSATSLAFQTGGRICYRVDTSLSTDDYGDTIRNEVRTPTDAAESHVISSEIYGSKMHKPVIDIDVPIRVYPSSTLGHFHLYIDHEMTWWQYRRLLRALVRAGLVEKGYAEVSGKRGGTHVRLPWVKKESA